MVQGQQKGVASAVGFRVSSSHNSSSHSLPCTPTAAGAERSTGIVQPFAKKDSARGLTHITWWLWLC
jgi:hypothetical protein